MKTITLTEYQWMVAIHTFQDRHQELTLVLAQLRSKDIHSGEFTESIVKDCVELDEILKQLGAL
jgi:hypothetical protein